MHVQNSLADNVEVNYKALYGLDRSLNVDIIRDLNELVLLNGFIAPKNSRILYSLCFKASFYGEDEKVFRERCTGVSPLIILIETTDGYRFGGYTSLHFETVAMNKVREDPNAFLFSFDTMKKYSVEQPEKAVMDIEGLFPIFGNNDFYIGKDFLSGLNCKTEFPSAFKKDVENLGDYVLNGGMQKFQVKELEVLIPYVIQ